jgi:hypothetical protein
MNNPRQCLFPVGILRSVTALLAALLLSAGVSLAQTLTLANPHWNITLTDAGYSDFLLDNTPGFEGREYLSGEWGAAVGYQRSGGPVVAPQWLEPQFWFPDWPTYTTFHTATPIVATGLNADSLPIAQSVITNGDLEIALRHEMLDTIVGTPMGVTPASAGGPSAYIQSDRYVLKQTATIRNISGVSLSNVQFYQFLHGLQSQRGVYDDRQHAGPLSAFRYDVTEWGVDAWAVGAGSSSAGLEDYIAFHAVLAPSAYEIGYYGIEGNGVDGHAVGKPSDGVHLSVEDNWQTAPYNSRQGTDSFTPPQRWIGGAQRWTLGPLAAGQSVSLDVLLTVRTGTRVIAGTGGSGGCNGGASVPGGVDYLFDNVSTEGSCFGEYSKPGAVELALHVASGEFDPFTFLTPGEPAQLWELSFSGVFSGSVALTFGYDPTILPAGFDQTGLLLYQFSGGVWQPCVCVVDPVLHTISTTTDSLGAFALGVDALVTVAVGTSVAPSGSGTTSGAGSYASGANVTLIAAANAGYVFSNWTEGATAVSASPSYTFIAQTDRTLVANFTPMGAAKSISTVSEPSNGGSTSGDGAYALGSSATVDAAANTGYKFSKWLANGVSVSVAAHYTFTVSGDRVLVAKFKPVYTVTVTPDPPDGGELEADPAYETGELAKLKAKPNSGYSFVNWTQNGAVVSTSTNYQFNVTGNRELVGHFALGHRIDAGAEPVNAGFATGGGVYPDGDPVTVSATANPGYVFLNWTESGTPVSTSPSYLFPSAANRALLANFIAQPSLQMWRSGPVSATLAWPAGASGWVLQECDEIVSGVWSNAVRQVDTVGSQKRVNLPRMGGNGFFRLIHP